MFKFIKKIPMRDYDPDPLLITVESCVVCAHLFEKQNMKSMPLSVNHPHILIYFCPSCTPEYDGRDYSKEEGYTYYKFLETRVKCNSKGQVKLSDLKSIVKIIDDTKNNH